MLGGSDVAKASEAMYSSGDALAVVKGNSNCPLSPQSSDRRR